MYRHIRSNLFLANVQELHGIQIAERDVLQERKKGAYCNTPLSFSNTPLSS
tara:strand:+ start:9770 stop:9922 length:153 start_codon:yes stop_codon:yes gene_type:complete